MTWLSMGRHADPIDGSDSTRGGIERLQNVLLYIFARHDANNPVRAMLFLLLLSST